MDPMTAIQVASAAFTGAQDALKIGKALYDFIKDTRQIDNTARDFASEVDALGSACSVVANMVQSIGQQHTRHQQIQDAPFSQSAQLWQCLERQVEGCRTTINQLSVAVSCVNKSDKQSSSLMNQAWRQIKLNLKAHDIEEVRNRIKSHSSSLQLTLQSVAISVSYVIPNRVDELLRSRLDELTDRQLQLLRLQEQRRDDAPRTPQQTDEAYILKASEMIKTTGESLYSSSQASGSVMGGDVEKVHYMNSWMNDIDAIDRVTSTSSTKLTATPPGSSTHYGASVEDTASTATSHDVDAEYPGRDDLSDTESDYELAIEATEMCMIQGKTAFGEDDYAQADTFLQEALKMVRELPSSRQNVCDIDDLRFMLGVCAFHLRDPAVAKEALLQTVNSIHGARNRDAEKLTPILEAGHLLAQVHLKLGELEQAKSICDSTLQGRSRVLGKTHESYYQSLALRIRIFELEGKVTRASSYARLLPSDQRDSLLQAVRHLHLASPAIAATASSENGLSNASPRPSTNTQPGSMGTANDLNKETGPAGASEDMTVTQQEKHSFTPPPAQTKFAETPLTRYKTNANATSSPKSAASVMSLLRASISISNSTITRAATSRTQFEIEVIPPSPSVSSWKITRKYPHFVTLHQNLVLICASANITSFLNAHSVLPTWDDDSTTETILRARMERYLFDALRYEEIADSSHMHAFLHDTVKPVPDDVSPPDSSTSSQSKHTQSTKQAEQRMTKDELASLRAAYRSETSLSDSRVQSEADALGIRLPSPQEHRRPQSPKRKARLAFLYPRKRT